MGPSLSAAPHTSHPLHWHPFAQVVTLGGSIMQDMGAALTLCCLTHNPSPACLQVATLGGSITRGTGATHPSLGYTSRFFSWINATFPHT